MHSSTDPDHDDPSARAGVYVIVLVLAGLAEAIVAVMSLWTLLNFDAPLAFARQLAPALGALGSIVALFRNQRWGLYGYVAMTGLQLVDCVLAAAVAKGVVLAVLLVCVVAVGRRPAAR